VKRRGSGDPQARTTYGNGAARELDVHPRLIWAYGWVECKNDAFLPSGRVSILFEGALFKKNTGGTFATVFPQISKTKPYGTYEFQWLKFALAAGLDFAAAVKSTSFGYFHILGDNHKHVGNKDIDDFFIDMPVSEHIHLSAFVKFVQWKKALHTAMQQCDPHDWVKLAKLHNGSAAVGEESYQAKLKQGYYARPC